MSVNTDHDPTQGDGGGGGPTEITTVVQNGRVYEVTNKTGESVDVTGDYTSSGSGSSSSGSGSSSSSKRKKPESHIEAVEIAQEKHTERGFTNYSNYGKRGNKDTSKAQKVDKIPEGDFSDFSDAAIRTVHDEHAYISDELAPILSDYVTTGKWNAEKETLYKEGVRSGKIKSTYLGAKIDEAQGNYWTLNKWKKDFPSVAARRGSFMGIFADPLNLLGSGAVGRVGSKVKTEKFFKESVNVAGDLEQKLGKKVVVQQTSDPKTNILVLGTEKSGGSVQAIRYSKSGRFGKERSVNIIEDFKGNEVSRGADTSVILGSTPRSGHKISKSGGVLADDSPIQKNLDPIYSQQQNRIQTSKAGADEGLVINEKVDYGKLPENYLSTQKVDSVSLSEKSVESTKVFGAHDSTSLKNFQNQFGVGKSKSKKNIEHSEKLVENIVDKKVKPAFYQSPSMDFKIFTGARKSKYPVEKEAPVDILKNYIDDQSTITKHSKKTDELLPDVFRSGKKSAIFSVSDDYLKKYAGDTTGPVVPGQRGFGESRHFENRMKIDDYIKSDKNNVDYFSKQSVNLGTSKKSDIPNFGTADKPASVLQQKTTKSDYLKSDYNIEDFISTPKSGGFDSASNFTPGVKFSLAPKTTQSSDFGVDFSGAVDVGFSSGALVDSKIDTGSTLKELSITDLDVPVKQTPTLDIFPRLDSGYVHRPFFDQGHKGSFDYVFKPISPTKPRTDTPLVPVRPIYEPPIIPIPKFAWFAQLGYHNESQKKLKKDKKKKKIFFGSNMPKWGLWGTTGAPELFTSHKENKIDKMFKKFDMF